VSIERLRELVSDKVGLIRNLAPQPRSALEPRPPHLYVAQLAHFDFRAAEAGERVGAGKGRTEEEAMSAAIGEAVERYCAFQFDPARCFVADWAAVRDAALSPAECVLYSEAQYAAGIARPRWRESDPVTWVHATELPSGRRVAVPASLTWLLQGLPGTGEQFAPASSNGLAAGPTQARAVLGGLCELMERDAFLITWMNRLPAIEIDLPASGAMAATLHRHYARFGVQVRAFAMHSDLPAATVMALSIDPDPSRPAHVVGLGCDPRPELALVKALFEMCQGRPAEARRFADQPPRGRLKTYADVKTLDDHSAFHSLPEQAQEFAFLWQDGSCSAIQDLPHQAEDNTERDLARCAQALARIGHRVAWVDLTLPDVARFGIHVVRVLASGLQPIHFGHRQERLGGRRLFEVPAKLGLAGAPRSADEFNPCPHPMA
jgi:ribosomal protein S12 methylthiotransferase accessory factor